MLPRVYKTTSDVYLLSHRVTNTIEDGIILARYCCFYATCEDAPSPTNLTNLTNSITDGLTIWTPDSDCTTLARDICQICKRNNNDEITHLMEKVEQLFTLAKIVYLVFDSYHIHPILMTSNNELACICDFFEDKITDSFCIELTPQTHRENITNCRYTLLARHCDNVAFGIRQHRETTQQMDDEEQDETPLTKAKLACEITRRLISFYFEFRRHFFTFSALKLKNLSTKKRERMLSFNGRRRVTAKTRSKIKSVSFRYLKKRIPKLKITMSQNEYETQIFKKIRGRLIRSIPASRDAVTDSNIDWSALIDFYQRYGKREIISAKSHSDVIDEVLLKWVKNGLWEKCIDNPNDITTLYEQDPADTIVSLNPESRRFRFSHMPFYVINNDEVQSIQEDDDIVMMEELKKNGRSGVSAISFTMPVVKDGKFIKEESAAYTAFNHLPQLSRMDYDLMRNWSPMYRYKYDNDDDQMFDKLKTEQCNHELSKSLIYAVVTEEAFRQDVYVISITMHKFILSNHANSEIDRVVEEFKKSMVHTRKSFLEYYSTTTFSQILEKISTSLSRQWKTVQKMVTTQFPTSERLREQSVFSINYLRLLGIEFKTSGLLKMIQLMRRVCAFCGYIITETDIYSKRKLQIVS